MASEKLARRYAAAVFALAGEQNVVEAVGRELRTVADAIFSEDAVRRFFVAPVIERKEKERVLCDAFEGKIHALALHTLLLLVRKRRESTLPGIAEQYAALERDARRREPLTVTSARELSDGEVRSLVARLEEIYRKKFDVTQKVEPGVIGGVRVRMGDRRVDATLAGRLDELGRRLLSKN